MIGSFFKKVTVKEFLRSTGKRREDEPPFCKLTAGCERWLPSRRPRPAGMRELPREPRLEDPLPYSGPDAAAALRQTNEGVFQRWPFTELIGGPLIELLYVLGEMLII